MSLNARSTSFQQGEEVNLTLALTNTSNQTRSITDVNGVSIFNFGVYDHDNNGIYSYEIGAYPIINKTIILLPKANYTETLTWEQGGIPYVHPSQEPAGTYYIVGNTNDSGLIPYLQTQRLTIVIKYPLMEIAIVFLIEIIACICLWLFFSWLRKNKRAKTDNVL